MGLIVVPTSDTNTIPPFNMHVLAGTTVTITDILAYTLTGSVVGAISQNGTGIPGLTAITITSTPTLFPPTNPVAVADGDAFAFTPASISSTPAGLTISFQKMLAAG